MSRLTGRTNSATQEAYNKLYPTRAKILVFVESPADVSFWYVILQPHEKQIKVRFDVSAYSDNNLTTGKDKLKKLFENTGQCYLICLDSDYDYLLSDKSDKSKEIKCNPYIFQTYAYAMENLKCYSESLNSLCVKATNSTDDTVDLSKFLEEYSRIIYPLLIWNIYYNRRKKITFSRKEFGKIVTFGDIEPDEYNITPNDYKKKLTIIKSSVTEKLNSFTSNKEFTNFSKQLNELGLNETNAYLFMNSHYLHDFISKFLVAICDALTNKRENDIKQLAKTEKEFVTKKAEYTNKVKNVTLLLDENDKFKDCFLFKKIEKDIQAYLEILKSSETHV